jgi:hypothetical protein
MNEQHHFTENQTNSTNFCNSTKSMASGEVQILLTLNKIVYILMFMAALFFLGIIVMIINARLPFDRKMMMEIPSSRVFSKEYS